jgi:hypothetical protein
MREDRILFTAVIANTFFWFLGSLLLLNIVLYATDILRVDEIHSSYLLAGLSLGIGIGSFLAGLASGHKIEYGMILPGIAAIVTMAALLSLPGLSFIGVLLLLALLGLAGGFFVVPINASIQHRPHPDEKGRTIDAAIRHAPPWPSQSRAHILDLRGHEPCRRLHPFPHAPATLARGPRLDSPAPKRYPIASV